jgi:predicted nucleic acid-binding protein
VKLYFDINVLLDVLADRQSWADDAAALLSLVERGHAVGLVGAHSVTTLSHLLGRELGTKRARKAVVDLLKLVTVVPLDEDRLLHALALGWTDFEDAVQAACALKVEADYIVTRDRDGFANSDVPAVSPAELLTLLRSSTEGG